MLSKACQNKSLIYQLQRPPTSLVWNTAACNGAKPEQEPLVPGQSRMNWGIWTNLGKVKSEVHRTARFEQKSLFHSLRTVSKPCGNFTISYLLLFNITVTI